MKNLFLLQDELDISCLDKNKSFRNVLVLPLNLTCLTYCHLNKLDYVNPIELMSKSFHKEAIIKSKNFEKSIKIKNYLNKIIKLEILVYLRFRFNSIFFLNNILEKIYKNYKIKQILIPQKIYKKHKIETFFLNEIFEYYLKQYKVKKISLLKNQEKNQSYDIFSYKINQKIKNKQKNILLSNLGYNFKRLIYLKKFKKFNLYYFSNKKPNFLIQILMNFFNIYPFVLEKQDKVSSSKKILITTNFKLQGKKLNNLFSVFMHKLSDHFIDLNERGLAVSKFLNENKFNLIVLNSVRDISGFFLNQYKKKSKVLNISHGTISASYNKYDQIYKKNIADSVVTNKANYVVAQSKISENFLNQNKYKKKIIKGNLIFSQVKKISNEYLLYATTTKTFYNMQFLGVEMYYEFFENLKFLNKFAYINKVKIIVKLHPSEIKNSNKLKKIFNSLFFSTSNIQKLLKKSFASLSFSSTVIEDSLNSKVPVILFDRWNRYKHCKIIDSKDNKTPLFHIKKKDDLLACVQKIQKQNNFDFSDYIFSDGYKKNLKNKITKLF